jgi:hypothetical protein
MDRLILRVLPPGFRRRHGREIHDMLRRTTRPVRDRADVVMAGVGLRLGRAIRPLLYAAVVGTGCFALATALAARDLQNGALELLDHWWSTFAATGFACSLIMLVVLALAQRRATAWGRPG